MNVPLKFEYALSALFDLAEQPAGTPVKISGIARRQKIPQKFLELILASLKQGGFVESKRGADGGYLLAKPAAGITVGEVLRYMEGQGGKRKRRDTPFSDLWKDVDRAVGEVVDRTSVEDLVRAWRDRREKYVPNWDI